MRQSTLELPDGRQVGFVDHGERDAPTVFYCHGTPGSRLELRLAQPVLDHEHLAIRLIALDRPGYGPSDFVALGGFLDWTNDVEALASHLGIGHFAVLGASGGAPFALACAHGLPDQVTRVGIVAGVAPPDVAGMEQSAALTSEPDTRWGRKLRYAGLSLAVRAGLTGHITRQIVRQLGPADRHVLTQPAAAAIFADIVEEAFAHFGRAAAREAEMLMQPWDFDTAQVPCPVHLWHGDADTRVPVAVATAFARRLRDVSVTRWPEHGHFSWATSHHVTAVVDYLTSAEPEAT